jgi:hypothetical protein
LIIPPLWKFGREIRRLYAKTLDIPHRLAADRRQAQYDRDKRLLITEGDCIRLDDLAVLLLYPVDGVATSTLEALEHLQSYGVAPVVVSNLLLSATDRAALAARAHLVIERPNRGYDFGGYRDGILEIISRGQITGHLFVLNDSIWFPLSENCTLVEDARRDPSDLFGIHFNYREDNPERSHLQSYFYRFGPRITGSANLADFWRDLIVYESKDLTIRRCEMVLTHWFASRGFTIGQVCKIEDFRAAISSLEGEDRTALVDYLVATGDKHASLSASRLKAGAYASGDDWKTDALDGLLGRFVLASHPTVLLEKLRFPVLKKDRQQIYHIQRAVALEDRYIHSLSKTVRAEMAERR